MNKTLLLILVDFLLLTLLSLVDWEEKEDAPAAEATPESDSVGVSSLALMEQDLMETLQSSLQEEKSERDTLLEKMDAREEELRMKEQLIAQKESSIEDLKTNLTVAEEREKALLEESKNLLETSEALNSTIEEREKAIVEIEESYASLDLKAKQSEAQSRLLQQELEARLAEIAEKEQALQAAENEKSESVARIQNLSVQVKVAEEQSRMLKENVETLRSEVSLEREERQRVQEQAGALAENLGTLAEKSEDLKEELRASIPVNANQLFDAFLKNRSKIAVVLERFSRGRVLEENGEAVSILVSDGRQSYALTHISNTKLEIGENAAGHRRLEATMQRGSVSIDCGELGFLALDPRIVAIPIGADQRESLGGEVYLTALEPFKFSEAVLIHSQGEYYGEVEFKLDSQTPGYVSMQTKIFSRLFGEFSPSRGDLVLSKTGELLGIMVDREHCVLIDNLLLQEKVAVGESFDNDELGRALSSLGERYGQLPSELR